MDNYNKVIKKLEEAKKAFESLNESDQNDIGEFLLYNKSNSFLNYLIEYFSEKDKVEELDHRFSNLKKKMNENKIKYKDINKKLSSIEDLLKQKEKEEADLIDKQERYEELNTKLLKIENLKTDLEGLDLMKIEKSYVSTQKIIASDLDLINGFLEKMNRLMITPINEVTEKLVQLLQLLNENKTLLESKNLEFLKTLKEGKSNIEILSKGTMKELDEKRESYNLYVNKLKEIKYELKEIDEVHLKNVTLYEKHFEANSKIWGGLRQKGQTKIYVEDLIKKIEDYLKEFDEQLKDLIAEKNKIVIMEYNPD